MTSCISIREMELRGGACVQKGREREIMTEERDFNKLADTLWSLVPR
jgi:hypothetical protein